MSDEYYEWSLRVPLPDKTPDYDPDELAEVLRELADRVAGEELPPTGDLWGRTGRLLGRADVIDAPDA